jgi:hypothetical protein
VLKGRVIGAAINEKGRPFLPKEIELLLGDQHSGEEAPG